jgi:hypothetical protein
MMAKNSGIETLIKKLGKLDVAELQELQKAAKTTAIGVLQKNPQK